MTERYPYTPTGKAPGVEPMRLTERQRAMADRWLVDNCSGLLRPHTATFMANGIAELLGIGIPPLEYDVLHPLCATARQRCGELGIEIRRLTRDDEGLGSTIRPAKPRRLRCTVCGRHFTTKGTSRRTRCDRCRHEGRTVSMRPRNCCICGREFQPKVHNAKCCSDACRAIMEHRRAKERQRAVRAAERERMNKD